MSNNRTMNTNSSSYFLGGRNKLRISLDVGSGVDNRRPDVAPSNPALTFAALWDPNDGIVTFSGTHLLDSPNECESSLRVLTFPNIFDDDVSGIVTCEHTDTGESAAAMVALKDTPTAFLHRVPRNSKSYKQHIHTNMLASSVLDRLDVCSRDPVVPTNSPIKRQYSARRSALLNEKSLLKTQAAFPNVFPESAGILDEGFFEDIPTVKGMTELKSHRSITTISTSTHVEAPYMSEKASERQSRIPHPLWIANKDQPVLNLTTPPKTLRRRLRKRRPNCLSSPSHSSNGSGYNSPVSPDGSPISPSRSFHSKRSRGQTRVQEDDNWVCIEITPFATQRIVQET